MVYLATLALAIAMLAGFFGIYDILGFSMETGFYAFWTLAIIGVGFLAFDVYRHGEHH